MMDFLKGNTSDLGLTDKQEQSCKKIIHGAATAAAGIGIVPLPGADLMPITAVQAGMIVALARVFDLRITEAVAKQAALGFIVGNTGRMIASSLTKVVPFLGSLICGGVAFTLTEVLGWEVVADFAERARQKAVDNEVKEPPYFDKYSEAVDAEVVEK